MQEHVELAPVLARVEQQAREVHGHVDRDHDGADDRSQDRERQERAVVLGAEPERDADPDHELHEHGHVRRTVDRVRAGRASPAAAGSGPSRTTSGWPRSSSRSSWRWPSSRSRGRSAPSRRPTRRARARPTGCRRRTSGTRRTGPARSTRPPRTSSGRRTRRSRCTTGSRPARSSGADPSPPPRAAPPPRTR